MKHVPREDQDRRGSPLLTTFDAAAVGCYTAVVWCACMCMCDVGGGSIFVASCCTSINCTAVRTRNTSHRMARVRKLFFAVFVPGTGLDSWLDIRSWRVRERRTCWRQQIRIFIGGNLHSGTTEQLFYTTAVQQHPTLSSTAGVPGPRRREPQPEQQYPDTGSNTVRYCTQAGYSKVVLFIVDCMSDRCGGVCTGILDYTVVV